MDPPRIVRPRHPEDDLAFGFHETFEDAVVQVRGLFGEHGRYRGEHLVHSLLELGLAGVPSQDGLEGRTDLGRQGVSIESC